MTINQTITDARLADIKHRYRDNADVMQVIEALECERSGDSVCKELRLRVAELEEDLADARGFI